MKKHFAKNKALAFHRSKEKPFSINVEGGDEEDEGSDTNISNLFRPMTTSDQHGRPVLRLKIVDAIATELQRLANNTRKKQV